MNGFFDVKSTNFLGGPNVQFLATFAITAIMLYQVSAKK